MKKNIIILVTVIIFASVITTVVLGSSGIFKWDKEKKSVVGENSEIYATVNGDPIYKSQIDFAVINSISGLTEEEAYNSILKVKLTEQEAIKQGITASEDEILKMRDDVFISPKKYEDEKDPEKIKDRNKYYEYVNKLGMSYKEFYDDVLKEQARTMVLSQKLSDKLANEQNILKTDREKNNEFMANYLITLEKNATIVKY